MFMHQPVSVGCGCDAHMTTKNKCHGSDLVLSV